MNNFGTGRLARVHADTFTMTQMCKSAVKISTFVRVQMLGVFNHLAPETR